MKIEPLYTIRRGMQDFAVCQKKLFRFDPKGRGYVYDLTRNALPVGEFLLDRAELICPHSNAVLFGPEKAGEADSFPLLYTNVYNNYRCAAAGEGRREGTLCVYRIREENGLYQSELKQLIQIAFTEDTALWKSLPDNQDVRPYGNFVPDVKNRLLHAFVMRDKEAVTRFFTFALPEAADGVPDERFGVPLVRLTAADILDSFDTPYMHFMQGAACRNGLIYSVEGFNAPSPQRPALRIIDTGKKREIFHRPLEELGLSAEPEGIDFDGDCCLYGDGSDQLYRICF